ncbi:MAG: hypothetical protein WC971_08415 [Coriobacteriia bacterium]
MDPRLVPLGGLFLFLVLLFQFLVGKRVIHFKGPLHMKVHRGVAWALLIAAPLHGLAATSVFLGWPFRL